MQNGIPKFYYLFGGSTPAAQSQPSPQPAPPPTPNTQIQTGDNDFANQAAQQKVAGVLTAQEQEAQKKSVLGD